jgi:hypothetical protein
MVTETTIAGALRPVADTSCQQSLDRWGWAATSGFAVGPWVLGLRSSSLELDAALRMLLRTAQAGDVQAPPNFSLFQAPAVAPGEPRRLHELFEGCGTRWRCRSLRELVEVLLLQLAGDALLDQDELFALSAVVLVEGGSAVLFPTTFRQPFVDALRVLARRGVQVWPATTVGLDPATREVVLPAVSLETDRAGWRAVSALDDGPALGLPAPGRYPIRTWCELQWRRGRPVPSRGQALQHAFPAVGNRQLLSAEVVLAGLADVLRSTEVSALVLEGDVAQAVLQRLGRA